MRLSSPPAAVVRDERGWYTFAGGRRRGALGKNRVQETRRKLTALRRLEARRRP